MGSELVFASGKLSRVGADSLMKEKIGRKTDMDDDAINLLEMFANEFTRRCCYIWELLM